MMFWTDAWKLGSSMWSNAVALQETALAAGGVIGHRSRTIEDAIRNPMQADMAELNRMVPEKMAAFGKAGGTIAEDWLDIHADLLAQGCDMMSLFAGSPPTTKTLARINRRGTKLALKMSTAGGRALKPVHAAATANHKRLNRAKKTPTGR